MVKDAAFPPPLRVAAEFHLAYGKVRNAHVTRVDLAPRQRLHDASQNVRVGSANRGDIRMANMGECEAVVETARTLQHAAARRTTGDRPARRRPHTKPHPRAAPKPATRPAPRKASGSPRAIASRPRGPSRCSRATPHRKQGAEKDGQMSSQRTAHVPFKAKAWIKADKPLAPGLRASLHPHPRCHPERQRRT